MRRHRWWALAALLLGATVVLFAVAERDARPPRRPEVSYPERNGYEDWKRQEARATLVLPQPPAPAGAPDPRRDEPVPRRDPFLVALPVKPDAPVLVLEANALRHSLLGERFLACMESRHPGDLAKMQAEIGIDPLKDIDRLGYTDDALVISGFFQGLRIENDFPAPPEPYGAAGRVYHEGSTKWLGVWRDQIVVLAPARAPIQRVIDQLEGRAPVPESGIPEDMAFGEVYAVVPGAAARNLLGADERGIGRQLAGLAERVELNVNAMQDVAAEIRVKGSDTAGLADLARAMGAALAVARVKAQAEGNAELADLLESAEVTPGSAEVTVRMAVPAAQLEKWFAGCARTAAPAGAPE
jgi:hypothetical protein